ncbi:MAG: hypothetical protein IPN18_18700 [Ignavibacteriales bacterium]|nr:hypothetical protein [Ignavibacteriales bacterium]
MNFILYCTRFNRFMVMQTRDPFALSGRIKRVFVEDKSPKTVDFDRCLSVRQSTGKFCDEGPQSEKAIIDLSKSRGLYIMAARSRPDSKEGE